MATIGLITKLEVVNSVLSVAGDSPVQSLDEGYQPVFIITEMMNNISRDMQTKKYWFNVHYDYELAPNTETGQIILPYNILSFEPVKPQYIARGLEVFDRVNKTKIISESIKADISVMLDFEELPQTARKYIQAKCREQYNDEYLGEEGSLQRKLAKELDEAEIALNREHTENEDYNIFNSSRSNSIAFSNRRRGS